MQTTFLEDRGAAAEICRLPAAPGKTTAFAALAALALLLAPPAVSAEEARIIALASPGLPDGAAPDGCRPALTGGGGPVAWKTTRWAGAAAIAETSQAAVDNRFPLCIVDAVQAADAEISVEFIPLEGKIDRAAGLAFRIKDANNYYVVRANALEGNVNLYHVVGGERRQFAGASAEVVSGALQSLAVRAEGDTFKVSLNGKPLFEARDSTIEGRGAVGVWSKADSVTAFGRFSATVLK